MTETVRLFEKNHNIVTLEHEMKVDGRHLTKKKQITMIGHWTIMVHIRTTDERTVQVT